MTGEDLFDGLDDLGLTVEEEGNIDLNEPSTRQDDASNAEGGSTTIPQEAEPASETQQNDNPPLDDGNRDGENPDTDLIDLDALLNGENTDEGEEDSSSDDEDTEGLLGNKEESTHDKTSSPSANVDAYKNFMENLHVEGALSSFDAEDFTKRAEAGENLDQLVIEAQKKELDAREQKFKDSLSEDDRAIYEGKKLGVPLDELGKVKRALKSYEKITDDFLGEPDNEEVAKKIITIDMQSKNYTEEEIQEHLEMYEEKDAIVSKAKPARERLVNSLRERENFLMENAEKETENRQRRVREYQEDLKNTINNAKELVPGLKLNKDMQEQLYKDLTEPVRVDDNEKPVDVISDVRQKNPKMFDIALRYYNRLGLFNFDEDGNFTPDLSKINSKLQTKESKRIKSILNTDSFPGGNNSKNRQISGKEDEDPLAGL